MKLRLSKITVVFLTLILSVIGGVSYLLLFQTKQAPIQTETEPKNLGAANTRVRQEINITDAYFYTPASTFATSSEIVAVTDSNYTAPTYYFEAIASSTSGTTGTIKLVNATSSAVVATLTLASGNAYTRYRSTAFVPNSSSTVEYKVVLGNEAVGKGLVASRIIVLQNSGAGDLEKTETQIEIGSATTSASNTTSLPLQDPKYWSYNSSKWDASPTFYVEATYKTNPVASSTTYSVSATSTPTFHTYIGSAGVGYVVGEAWGGGGGGDGATSGATIGGGGGGGGTYARATTTVAAGSSNRIGVGQGGAEGVVKAVTASSTLTTAAGLVLAAEGGEGATTASGAATSTLASSVGGVITAGGSGGNGETTTDTGGGGGGSAGPDGYGISGKNAAANGPGGAGGAGNLALGGAGGAGGNGGDDTCDTELGGPGVNNVLGAGGGGGADGDVSSTCSGGNGGRPGGGGGGSDEGATGIGGPGQVKITEYIGTVGIALQEDDGNFGSWTFNQQVITVGKTSTTTERVRVSFTPTNGKHYRLVASTTNSTAPYDIYNAKIVVVQAGSVDASFSPTIALDETICVSCSKRKVAETFTSGGGTLATMKWKVAISVGAPTGNVVAELFATSAGAPSGSALATSDSLDATTITSSYVEYTFTFSGANQYAKANGTVYAAAVSFSGGDASNSIKIGSDNANNYAGGVGYNYDGATWNTAIGSSDRYFSVNNSNPTLLEPQYLLAPYKLPSGTAVQKFLTYYDPAEWSTSNAFLIQADAADNSSSDATIVDSTGATTYATQLNPDNSATSTFACLPSAATLWDVLATTNNSDIFSVRALVQVGGTQTSTCAGPTVASPAIIINSNTVIQGQVIIP